MLSVAANTNRCSKNVTQDGKPVVVEKAPNDQSVDALADPVSFVISTVTTVALVNPVTFACPFLNLINLPTSVETNKLALAVKVLPVPTVWAEAVIVVVDIFATIPRRLRILL